MYKTSVFQKNLDAVLMAVTQILGIGTTPKTQGTVFI